MNRKGFTLIELLVVILILAILMAIALPLYLRAVADSARQTCRSNMQTIANAEQAYKVRSPAHVYTTDLSPASPLVGTPADPGDLTSIPTCPKGGIYSVALDLPTPGSMTISCSYIDSVAGPHGNFIPGGINP